MRVVDLIRRKRDGEEHSSEEIRTLIDGYTRGDIPDYQMSAWLMAAFLRGLSGAETAALTSAMLHSGKVLDFSDVPGRKVDKHSTGGVGDKTSLIVAPIAAMLIQMSISRTREFSADAASAKYTGSPDELIGALRKLEIGVQQVPMADASPATAHMFILNPFSGGGLARLFSTHPSTEERIARLQAMRGALG